jgi:hypothetical protein
MVLFRVFLYHTTVNGDVDHQGSLDLEVDLRKKTDDQMDEIETGKEIARNFAVAKFREESSKDQNYDWRLLRLYKIHNLECINKSAISQQYDVCKLTKDVIDLTKTQAYEHMLTLAGIRGETEETFENYLLKPSQDRMKAKGILWAAGKTKSKKSAHKRSDKKVKLGSAERCVYVGPRGGEYVKMDGKFVPLKKALESANKRK